jgi:hypothetical protein
MFFVQEAECQPRRLAGRIGISLCDIAVRATIRATPTSVWAFRLPFEKAHNALQQVSDRVAGFSAKNRVTNSMLQRGLPNRYDKAETGFSPKSLDTVAGVKSFAREPSGCLPTLAQA